MVASRASTSRISRPSPRVHVESRPKSYDDDENGDKGKGKGKGNDEEHHQRNDDGDKDEQDDQDDDDSSSFSSSSDGEGIFRRIPIFFNPTSVDGLALLQYPDRPQKRTTSHPLIPPSLRPDADDPHRAPEHQVQARYKPSSQHLEISIPIERDHPQRWNDDQARLFASGVITDADRAKETQARLDAALGKKGGAGGGRKGRKNQLVDEEEERREREQKEKRRLERINYKSIALPEVTHYFVSVVRDDSVHISPLTQTFQLRPNLQYLDQIITNERRRKREEKASADADADSDGDISDAELKKEEAKAVQVSVKQEAEGASAVGGWAIGDLRMGVRARVCSPLCDRRRTRNGSRPSISMQRANQGFDKVVIPGDASYNELNGTVKPREYLLG
ncbi:BQ2448_932 [Microbotryum intermedium]|uniref:BQ2448_932 protein n=1 Tax=Microbotryum intermedium TaxID=269621 RepID=A0A238F9L9_9BASI|nr:BQ2448_932 [Microbotryum intermedium]